MLSKSRYSGPIKNLLSAHSAAGARVPLIDEITRVLGANDVIEGRPWGCASSTTDTSKVSGKPPIASTPNKAGVVLSVTTESDSSTHHDKYPWIGAINLTEV